MVYEGCELAVLRLRGTRGVREGEGRTFRKRSDAPGKKWFYIFTFPVREVKDIWANVREVKTKIFKAGKISQMIL